jgi:hypothetical protein
MVVSTKKCSLFDNLQLQRSASRERATVDVRAVVGSQFCPHVAKKGVLDLDKTTMTSN